MSKNLASGGCLSQCRRHQEIYLAALWPLELEAEACAVLEGLGRSLLGLEPKVPRNKGVLSSAAATTRTRANWMVMQWLFGCWLLLKAAISFFWRATQTVRVLRANLLGGPGRVAGRHRVVNLKHAIQQGLVQKVSALLLPERAWRVLYKLARMPYVCDLW